MVKPIVSLVFASLFLVGCAQVKNIKLKEEFWQTPNQKVAVAKSKMVKPSMYQTGREGLLDIAINSAVNYGFTNYLERYDLQPLNNLKKEFAQKLHEHGIKSKLSISDVVIEDLPSSHQDTNKYAARTFTGLANKYSSDQLLILEVKQIGAIRQYYGFSPQGAPKAICDVEGQLVKLKSNEVLWRYDSKVTIDVSGDWDQPPHYSNFTKALDKAVATAKEELLDDFFFGVAARGNGK